MLQDQALEDILVQQQAVSPERLKEAKELAASLGSSLERILVDKGYIARDKLGSLIAQYYGVEYARIPQQINEELLQFIPEETAVAKKILPYAREGETLFLAMVNPSDFETINFIEKRSGMFVKPVFSFEDELFQGMSQYKRDIKKEFEQIVQAIHPERPVAEDDLIKVAEELPVIRALDTMLEYAIAQHASDVHLQGEERHLTVRMRVDGILKDVLILSKNVQPALVARVKVLSNLKIDEHRVPQDGRFKFEKQGRAVAIRVSIIPSFWGENVVLRLLQESSRPLTFDELGISGRNSQVLQASIKKTAGIILVTGPTGSGKTTTLYSVLNILNQPAVKLATVEDPVEYGIPRITQIQVNPTAGLGFASGLRSLLRHDPDIIMVGEIRDKETANIAINAALTGHLVLSTLHTNDAPSAIPRLIDLGAQDFLVASTVQLIIAQRLVRRLCKECAVKVKLSESLLGDLLPLATLDKQKISAMDFYQARACPACDTTGYRGRIGIFEMFGLDDKMRDLVLKRVPVDKLKHTALTSGMTTMVDDGILKASQGMTTIEEVLRVSRE